MRDLVLSLLAGGICGAVFAVVRLPIPAPPVWSGVVGIAGVVLGWQIVSRFLS